METSSSTKTDTENPGANLDETCEKNAKTDVKSLDSQGIIKVKTEDNIIDLVPKQTNSICINFACKNGQELIEAPSFCLSYFRVKSSTKMNKKVCLECYNIAVKMYDHLVTELKNGNLLFDVTVPLLNDMVEIDDSDEDETEENQPKDYLDDENLQFITENIDSVLNETILKYKLAEQVVKEEANIRERLKKTQEECKELCDNLKEMRSKVDSIQINFYNTFKPETREKPLAMDIVDDYTISPETNCKLVPINQVSYNRKASAMSNADVYNKFIEPQRKSVRKTRPVSYSELEDGATNPNSPTPPPLQPSPKIIEKKDDKINIYKAAEPADLPPIGPVQRPPLEIGEIYYISRDGTTSGSNWVRARLNSFLPPLAIHNGVKLTTHMYKFTELKKHKERLVDGKKVAYVYPSSTRLRVGERVIARFKENEKNRTNPYYPGIVAEPPYQANNYRYLIFFDIGYSQYVPHDMVNLVHKVSEKVWEDMPPDCRMFIRKHIESQDWPMVKLKKDQGIITEYNGKWMLCTVINVDCSLVQVYFDELNRFEWIYRGSRRIREIYREEMAASNRSTGHRTSRKAQTDSKNIVQYTPNLNFTTQDSAVEKPKVQSKDNKPEAKIESAAPSIQSNSAATVKAVARKSTNSTKTNIELPTATPFLTPSGPTSKIMYFTPRNQSTMKRLYHSHECSPDCKQFLTHNCNKLRGQNPLSKPLLCGWVRMTVKVRGRKDIAYKAPCGRMMRSIAEVHYYLSITKSEMTVDLFDFNHMVRCLAEFSVDCEPDPKDLSKGQEQVPISVINGFNNVMLDFCNYSTKRVPMEGVEMNLDPEFLVCCDCEDDCIDKTKCACWKLTLEGAYFFDSTVDPNSVGYIYRRLPDQVVTGIYECNSRCKCTKTCLNRVAQNPMSLKLQVFRTHNRGWGIRCLNDVPQGTFICVYAGTIHTDQEANRDGKTFGDEYFAELDYIESVEKFKEDYEKGVDTEELDKPANSPNSEENEEFPAWKKQRSKNEDSEPNRRLRKRKYADSSDSDNDKDEKIGKLTNKIETVTISDEEDVDREILSFNPQHTTNMNEEKSDYLSVRELYGANERIYIMDAKNAGNIGRFLNHSCAPNVFVQNVFVDTHDPRFPWVAFFSSQFIRAGTELTWNYSYDVGSVPDKVIYCHCAALECKGRLL